MAINNEEKYDLLIKGGHIIDPANKINNKMDIAIKDKKIVQIESEISSERASKIVKASGYYV
ncbi:MAG: amidohydrolase/deacetylase family metallohydrolase, partial [Candidatus Poribacteria bacterium]